MYEKILKWYGQGLWNETMVRNAATKKVITEEQMNNILNSKEG